jgi:hypothetical protein
MNSILIAGGYGVFGSRIARELRDFPLTIAGRHWAKASRFAATLGTNARGIAMDVRDLESCRKAFAGHCLVIHAAGPFAGQGTCVLEACLESKSHVIDIADDRDYVARVRSFHDRFAAAGLVAAYGCSSLPGISGALATRLRAQSPATPVRIRVTLFIGNRNAKGEAAVRSVFRILGRTIKTPGGPMPGFGDPEPINLPAPWGQRVVFNFDSPEYDLFPRLFGSRSVSVKLGFEFGVVSRGFRLLSRFPQIVRDAAFKPLVAMGNLFGFVGSSGGAVVVEFFFADGSRSEASVVARQDGQRLAIVPCVLVARKLMSVGAAAAGTRAPWEILEAEEIIYSI